MTLNYFTDYSELFDKAVLWWTGYDLTITGFPIIPAGVTPTPNGTWANDLSLGNNKICKTFNGSTNYISLNDNDAWYFGTGDFTVSFWTYYKTMTQYYYVEICIFNSTSDRLTVFFDNYPGVYKGACMTYPADRSVVNLYDNALGSYVNNTWYHMTFVRNGSVFYIYRNGIVVAQTSASLNIPNMTGNLYIGYDNCGGTAYHFGNLKDLMIFKGRALTQPEIITLMRLTEPGKRDITPVMSGVRGVE